MQSLKTDAVAKEDLNAPNLMLTVPKLPGLMNRL